jgi:hypothetical protein
LAINPTAALLVEVLFVISGSVTPFGGVIDAEFVIEPVAVLATVPVIVMVRLPPDGKTGIRLETLLPEIDTVDGQTAPLMAAPQLAEIDPIDDGTASKNEAPSALLGPAFAIVTA